jgi:hypothetical protein
VKDLKSLIRCPSGIVSFHNLIVIQISHTSNAEIEVVIRGILQMAEQLQERNRGARIVKAENAAIGNTNITHVLCLLLDHMSSVCHRIDLLNVLTDALHTGTEVY